MKAVLALLLKTDPWIFEIHKRDTRTDFKDSFFDFEYFQLLRYGFEDVLNFSCVPSSQISNFWIALSCSMLDEIFNLLNLVINYILAEIDFVALVVLASFIHFKRGTA